MISDIDPCPACGALPCDWVNNPHLTPLSPADNGARREAVLPIVMRGFRERLSAIDTTDLIIASLSPTTPLIADHANKPTTDAVRGEVEAKSISVAEEWSVYMDEAVSKAPEPLRKLGEYLADLLDEDQWKTAERYLNAAVLATLHPSPEDPSGGQDVEAACDAFMNKIVVGGNGGLEFLEEALLDAFAALRAPVERKGEG